MDEEWHTISRNKAKLAHTREQGRDNSPAALGGGKMTAATMARKDDSGHHGPM